MSFWKKVRQALTGEEAYEETVEGEVLPIQVQDELETEVAAEAEPPEPAPPEVVKLLELKGKLPFDFPAHRQLHDAGINTYGQLAKVDDPATIHGIGKQFAEKIAVRLVCDLKDMNTPE